METMRSVLFTPGNQDRRVAKALDLPVDAVCLDLEDSVPPDDKPAARAIIRERVSALEQRDTPQILVRVNPIDSGFLFEDLVAVVGLARVSAIMLPKAETRQCVLAADTMLTSLEGPRDSAGRLRIVPLLETALGVFNALEITRSCERIETAAFGAVDFAADLGVRWTKEGQERVMARSWVAMACAASGLAGPLDSVFIDVRDSDGFVEEARSAYSLGYQGKLLIHPNQIDDCNQAFTPRSDEISYAREVLDAFASAEESGRGAIQVQGRMVDYAVIKWAQKIKLRADLAGLW